MTIPAIAPVAAQAPQAVNAVHANQTAAFEKLLQPPVATPENAALQALQNSAQQIDKAMKPQLPAADSLSISPEQMLTAQQNLMQPVVQVDVAAKIGGSVSQSINKLVNMS